MKLTSAYLDTSINIISDIGLPITPVKCISVRFTVPKFLYGVAWLRLELSGLFFFFFFENQNGAAATVTSARYVHMLQAFVVPQINCLGRNSGELWWQDGATAIQPEHVWRSCAKCFQTASFSVMVAFHDQQNPQTLVHVTFSVGLSQR
jgi:hypothetical protein